AQAINGYNYPFSTSFLDTAAVDRNPPHVTFAYVPAADAAALELVHDHAYWISEVRLTSTTGGTTPAKGVIDALSHGFGLGDAPGGVLLDVAAGTHSYAIACLSDFDLRRLVLVRRGAGSDRLMLRARMPSSLAALGLPGAAITVKLANTGGTFFTATVPAARLIPNANGSRLRFHDASGTV